MVRTIAFGLGGFQVLSGVDAIKQRVVEHVSFIRGEWFLDNRAGTPYYERIFTNPRDVGLIVEVIAAEVETNVHSSIQRVTVLDYTLTNRTRELEALQLFIETTEGDITVEVTL